MITYPLAIIVGWLLGMLVNYIADVLPLRRKLTLPFCIQCDTSQSWLNYLLWPRRCPTCSHRRALRTWMVEGFFILASVWLIQYPPAKLGYWLGMLLLAYFGVVVLIDMEYRLIMHPVSIFGAVLGFLLGLIYVGWWRSLLGGVVGFGLMWLLYQLGVLIIKLVKRSRGQLADEVALGFGDVNLSGVLGLILGWPAILIGLVVAVLIGGLVSLFYLLFKILTRQYQAFMAIFGHWGRVADLLPRLGSGYAWELDLQLNQVQNLDSSR
jgi:prepilin signal peptidase PulO-like enzyme (type II secretory pathway)